MPVITGCLSLAAALLASVRPPSAGPVAALFPPWWSAAQAATAASRAGRVIRLGAVPFVVVVTASNADTHQALHRAGAWLLLDPVVLTGCLPLSGETPHAL